MKAADEMQSLPRSGYRTQSEILAEILELSKEMIFVTKIMYKSNLSFQQLIVYTKLLADNELITITEEKHGKQTRRGALITQKGLKLLNLLNKTAPFLSK